MTEVPPQEPARHAAGTPSVPRGRYDEGEVAEEVIDEEAGVHGRFDEGQASDATLDAEEGVKGSFDEGQATDDTPSPAP